MLELSYPREFQWSGDRNDLVPTFIDMTPLLVPGPNAITIELESSLCAGNGPNRGGSRTVERRASRSRQRPGMARRAGAASATPLAWNDLHYPDRDWHEAIQVITDEDDTFYRTFDTRLITTPFNGIGSATPRRHRVMPSGSRPNGTSMPGPTKPGSGWP